MVVNRWLMVGILLFAGLSVGGWWWLIMHLRCRYDRESRAYRRLCRRRVCDSGDGVGCSLLVRAPRSVEDLSRLLKIEMANCEVVAVVDGKERPELMRHLIEDFSLIRVEYRPSDELPVFGVRGLYRSSRRAFQRLLVVDRCTSNREDDWTVAASLATYEWFLPLEGRAEFSLEVVEELLAAVEQSPCRVVYGVASGDRLWLVARDQVVKSGGFGPDLWRRIHRKLLRLWSLRVNSAKF